MIRHEKDGWHLYSQDGSKHLGGPWETRDEAVRREHQVQWFKTNKEGLIPAGADMSDPAVQMQSFATQKEPTKTQSVVLDKKTFPTRAAADKWMKAHEDQYKIGQVDETPSEWRYRQEDPAKFKPDSYRSFPVPKAPGVRLILGKLK